MTVMKVLKNLSIVCACLWLAACSTTGGNPAANDPYESTNREIFDFDMRLDRHGLLPTAACYAQVVPEPARDGVHNFLQNLDLPVTFANDLLQGETTRGSETFARFFVNTTFGLGGLFDVATRWGIPNHSEDFGQTLAVWGAGEGPYLVLPFGGPSTPRDFAGNIIDNAFDPTTYIAYNYKFYWSVGRTLVHVIDVRARSASLLQTIERGSVDYYASVRSLYRQNRQNEINNGKVNLENLPEF
jgi:phospholipid-binding lipoprotein MlaA